MRLPLEVCSIERRSNTRSGKTNSPDKLVIHSTANKGSTAKNEADWLNNPNNHRVGSWHFCVDDEQVVSAIPVNEEAFHASDNEVNKSSISLEICESGNRENTLHNAVITAANLMAKFNLKTICRHDDFTSSKVCPHILPSGDVWHKFKSNVLAEVKKLKTPIKPNPTTNPELRQGSVGPAVRHLKTLLKAHKISIKIDSVFDIGTTLAVKKFQTTHDLEADGIVGAKTWIKLQYK